MDVYMNFIELHTHSIEMISYTVPQEICHAVFPTGIGVGSQQRLNFCKMQQLHIGESCDDLLGATVLVILYVVLRYAAKISRGFLPDCFQFCRRQKGDQKWRPKMGSVKLNFAFGGTVLGPAFGPCFQFPQGSQKCANRWTKPAKFWRQGHSQARSQGPQPAVTSHHSGPFPQDLRCSCQ